MSYSQMFQRPVQAGTWVPLPSSMVAVLLAGQRSEKTTFLPS
jgi:hypothetical protein